jgi:hypothetical protein
VAELGAEGARKFPTQTGGNKVPRGNATPRKPWPEPTLILDICGQGKKSVRVNAGGEAVGRLFEEWSSGVLMESQDSPRPERTRRARSASVAFQYRRETF